MEPRVFALFLRHFPVPAGGEGPGAHDAGAGRARGSDNTSDSFIPVPRHQFNINQFSMKLTSIARRGHGLGEYLPALDDVASLFIPALRQHRLTSDRYVPDQYLPHLTAHDRLDALDLRLRDITTL